MAGMSSAHAPERRGFGVAGINWRPFTTAAWMWTAFLIALALAAIVLVIFGVGERGTGTALRVTAKVVPSPVLARICWKCDWVAV